MLFGTFCNGVNEVSRIKHCKAMVNYLDSTYDHIANKKGIFQNEDFIPEVFSSFSDKDKYNGIPLREAMLKRTFLKYVTAQENYVQQSFQLHHDHSYAGDHAHKFSKQITSSNRADKLFTASYTVTSMLGQVVSSRLTFTKSNEELDPVLKGLATICSNMGVSDLKRYETDNAAGDGNLWARHFPELKKNVHQSIQLNDTRYATINDDNYIYITNKNATNTWALSVISALDSPSSTCAGIDCEWNYLDGTADITRTLQLSFPNQKVAVLHLSKMNILIPESFPLSLKHLLELDSLLYCSQNVSIDCNHVEILGVTLKKRFELQQAALYNDPNIRATSLENLASTYLGLNLNKVHRNEDFSINPLPITLQKYAALDALVSRKIGELLQSKITMDSSNLRPAMIEIEKDDTASYLIGRRVAASGTITFVGGNRYQRKHGNVTVGSNKVLFKIETVTIKSAKPPIKCSLFPSDYTLEDILHNLNPPEITLHASSVEKHSVINPNMMLNDFHTDINLDAIVNDSLEESLCTSPSLSPPSAVIAPNVDTAGESNITENFQVHYEYESCEDIDEEGWSYSQIKEDIFHRFQDITIKKGSPCKPAIVNLLINCTFKNARKTTNLSLRS